jgi:hypothetical protein
MDGCGTGTLLLGYPALWDAEAHIIGEANVGLCAAGAWVSAAAYPSPLPTPSLLAGLAPL